MHKTKGIKRIQVKYYFHQQHFAAVLAWEPNIWPSLHWERGFPWQLSLTYETGQTPICSPLAAGDICGAGSTGTEQENHKIKGTVERGKEKSVNWD